MLTRQKKVILGLTAIVLLTLGAAAKATVTDEIIFVREAFLEYLANLPNRTDLGIRPIVVEKGTVVVGNRRLLISPVVENYVEQ